MSDSPTRPKDVRDFLHPAPGSDDPAYRAWAEAKIRRAVAADEAAPDSAVPEREVWKRFGLEY